MVERVSTGIKGFDELVEGGFPKGHTILVSGMPGSGKSIFCLQALCNNAVRGKNCLFISFEESVEDLHDQMKEFNWAFNGVDGHLKI